MTREQLRLGRERKGWGQEQAAARLGVSQPYLSLLERGERRVPEKLARKAVGLYELSAETLPVETSWDSVRPADESVLASELAALGYPGLSYLRARRRKNPAEVLLSALSADDLDSRLTEALPWVVWRFPELDWRWLTGAAKLNDLQNRLGFVTSVARRLAERSGELDKALLLGRQESVLERSRLAREDTLCRSSLTESERRWLQEHRPDEARHWRLLTDLSPDHLSYAG
jgi:transcriptional regulator with XRE-family HTH domain